MRPVDWPGYANFVVFATVLVLVPGPDFAVVSRNAISGGRWRGGWSGVGVASSNAVQGVIAAVGLGALIVASRPVFTAVKWAGIAYLVLLGLQAARSAWRGRYDTPVTSRSASSAGRAAWAGWRQGFLSNITNPKVLVFYLAVLPQFLAPGAATWQLGVLALTHAVLSLGYLLLLVAGLHRIRRLITRRPVRRSLDAATAAALLGFGGLLARDQLARAS